MTITAEEIKGISIHYKGPEGRPKTYTYEETTEIARKMAEEAGMDLTGPCPSPYKDECTGEGKIVADPMDAVLEEMIIPALLCDGCEAEAYLEA